MLAFAGDLVALSREFDSLLTVGISSRGVETECIVATLVLDMFLLAGKCFGISTCQKHHAVNFPCDVKSVIQKTVTHSLPITKYQLSRNRRAFCLTMTEDRSPKTRHAFSSSMTKYQWQNCFA
jgi:hypothetical protein